MSVFVLFSQQRSGTGAFVSFLTSHPGIKNGSEVLNPYDVNHDDNFFHFWQQSDPVAALQKHISPSQIFVEHINSLERKYADSTLIIDIKLNSIRHVVNYWEELGGYTDARLPWLIRFFKERNYPALYIHRENHLHRFVSSKIVGVTGVYRSHERTPGDHVALEVDTGEMMRFITHSEASHHLFMPMLEKFERRLYLTYDDIFVGSAIRSDAKIKAAQFLGTPFLVDREPYYIKLRTYPLEKTLINYDEVASELERSGRLHYLVG